MCNGTVLKVISNSSKITRNARRITILLVIFMLLSSYLNTLQAQLPTAWVVNSLGESLSKVNLQNGQVDLNAVLLGSAPNDIVIREDIAYVVNSLTNNLQIIDLIAVQTIGTVEITLGLNPYNLTLTNDDRAFVSNWLTGNVSIINLQTNLETDTIAMGGTPQGLLATDDRLYVTDANFQGSSYGTGHLVIYSLPDVAFIARIDVGTNPQIVKVGPDGNLHVVCTGNYVDIPGRIDVINPGSLQRVISIPLGGSPGSLGFTSQNLAYLGAAGWGGPGNVMSYNGMTHQILHGSQNPIEVSSAAMGISITLSDNILVCCFNTDQLVELNADGDSVTTYNVGDGPQAVALQQPPAGLMPVKNRIVSYEFAYNFPQPFNSMTTIKYHLKSATDTKLIVFDHMGRQIHSTDMGRCSAGDNFIFFSPDGNWSSGNYFYEIRTLEDVQRGSMLYLK